MSNDGTNHQILGDGTTIMQLHNSTLVSTSAVAGGLANASDWNFANWFTMEIRLKSANGSVEPYA